MNGKLTLISLSRTHKYLLLLVLKYFIHPLFPQRKALSFSVSIANLSPPRHLHRKKVIKYPLTILLKILNVFIPRQTCVTIKTSKCEKYFHLYPLLIVIIPLYYVALLLILSLEKKKSIIITPSSSFRWGPGTCSPPGAGRSQRHRRSTGIPRLLGIRPPHTGG